MQEVALSGLSAPVGYSVIPCHHESLRMRRRKTNCSLFAVGVLISGQVLAQSTERPAPPTRDPHTPGYVTAKELPDGSVPPSDADGNFIIGADAHSPAPEMAAKDDVPKGTVIEFTMNSSDSKIYPGITREAEYIRNSRPFRPGEAHRQDQPFCSLREEKLLSIPKQYVADSVAPFVVGTDGPDLRLFAALDGLIAQHKVQ